MAVKSVAELKAYANANRTSNGVNSNTGNTENILWIDVIDSFFSKLGTPAVTGAGTAGKIMKWATANIAAAGTWTHTINDLVPDNNNSKIGSVTFGVQAFYAAATATTAPINLRTSAGLNPTSPTEGMLWYNGTQLYFKDSTTSINLLAAGTLSGSGTTNTVALFTASGVIGDSYMTQTAAGVGILTKTLGIGNAADSTTGIYMDTTLLRFPVFIDAAYTGGSDHEAGFFAAGGINAANNTGVYGTAILGAKNIGVHGVSSATSNESVGVIGHSGALPTSSWEGFATANNLESVGGMFMSVWGSAANGAAIAGKATGSTSGSNFGIDLVVTNGGAGGAFGMRVSDGTEGLGKVLVGDATGRTQWEFLGWTKVTKAHTAFQVASTTTDIEIFSAIAGEKITDVIMDATAGMTGGSIATYTMSIGLTGDLAKYASAFSVFGISATPDHTLNNDFPDWAGVSSIRAAAIATGANLDQSLAGSVDFYIRTEKVK